MVNKRDEFDFDIDDIDNLDFDDSGYDDGGESKRGSREPISKLLGGFRRGTSNVLKSEHTQRAFIRDALPDGYSHVYDAALTVKKGVTDMYRDAGDELRKVNNETKKVVRKILPHIKSTLPKSMAAKATRYAGEEHNFKARDYESDEIAMALSDIFGRDSTGYGVGENAALNENPLRSTKDAIDMTETIVNNKLQLNIGQSLNRILSFASKQDAYSSKVGQKLERKKVELAYKQLFTQTKIMNNLQEMLGLQQAAFKDIIQNTSLPDIVKEHQSEKFHDMTRRAFYGKVADPVTNSLSGFVHTMVGKTRSKIKETAEDFTSNLSMGSDAIELYFEMKQLEKEMEEMMNEGQSPPKEMSDRHKYLMQALEAGGELAGGFVAQRASRKVAKFVKNKWGDNEQVKRAGLAGKNFVNNFDEYKRDFMDDLHSQFGPLGKFFEWIGMDYNQSGQSNVLQGSPLEGLRQRAVYTYKTERTINTVIPGLLAKIHNEIRILRTGDASLEPISYDFESDQFQDRSERRARILDRVLDSGQIKNARGSLDDLMDTFEAGGSGSKQLSPEARSAIAEYAVNNARNGKSSFSLRDLAGHDSPIKDQDIADEVREFLRDGVGIDAWDDTDYTGSDVVRKAKADMSGSLKYQELRDKLTAKMGDLTGRMPQDFSAALDVTKQEDLDILRELGLAKQGTSPGTWEYDHTALYKKLFGADIGPNLPNNKPNNPNNLPIFGGASGEDPITTQIKESNTKLAKLIELVGAIRTKVAGRSPTPPPDPGADDTTDQNQFDAGGYTGAGPKNEVAGTIHRGEVVFSKEDIARNGGVSMVERIRRFGRGFASGGYTGIDGAEHEPVRSSGGFKGLFDQLLKSGKEHHDDLIKALDENFASTNETLLNLSGSGLGEGGPMKKGLFRRALGMGKNAFMTGSRWSWNAATAPARIGMAGLRGVGGIFSALTKNRERLQGIDGKSVDKARDLYVKDRRDAVITARDLKSGNLIDVNSGKVISKIGDITGEVRHRDDYIVLTAAEFASGLYTLEKGSLLPRLIAGGIKGVGKLVGAGMSVASLPMKLGLLPLKAARGLWRMSKRMGDIYVAGEQSPRLLATLLNNNGYIVAHTGKPVQSFADITGEIKTLDGETVLTHSDIQKGLLDSRGKPIRLMRDKIAGIARAGFNAVVSTLGLGFKLATLPAVLAGKATMGVSKRLLGVGQTTKVEAKATTWLEKIYKLLDDRMDKRSKVLGDIDGDGDRDGSAMDRLMNDADKPEEVKPKSEQGKEKKEGKGLIGLFMSLVAGGFAKVGLFGTKVISWLRKIAILNAVKGAGDSMAGGGLGGRGRGGMGRAGRIGTALSVGASIYGASTLFGSDADDMFSGEDGESKGSTGEDGKSEDPSLWDQYGDIGTAVGGGLAADYLLNRGGRSSDIEVDPTTGARRDPHGPPRQGRWSKFKDGAKRFGGRALDAGKRYGGKALTSGRGLLTRLGGSTAASFIGRQALWTGVRAAAVAGGTALAGVISAPVVIGAAAVAGLGIGAYYAYKYFNRETDVLKNFRINQYGFDEDDEKSAEKLMQLEKMLLDVTSISKGQAATLGKGVNVTQVAELFNVDTQNKTDIYKLITWFNGRFKPVFLGAVTVYNRLTGGKDIHGADQKLNKEDKIKFLTGTHITGGGTNNPYLIAANPFAGENTVEFMSSEVDDSFKSAMKKIGKLKDTVKGPAQSNQQQKSVDSNTGEQSWWDKTKENAKSFWASTKDALSNGYDKFNNFIGEHGSKLPGPLGLAATAVNAVTGGRGLEGLGDKVSGFISKLTGKQQEIQLAVYKSFRNAGLNDNQARIMTAEIGRENDYNPRYVFGGHNDPANGKYNLGFLSWQGSRGKNLYNFLKSKGLINNDKIVESQAALDAQAAFAMNEIQTFRDYKATKDKFVNNPNVTYQEGARVLGTNFIRWRYDDQKYASHHKRRDGFYNKLNELLGKGASANIDQVAGNTGGANSPIAGKDSSGKTLPVGIGRPAAASFSTPTGTNGKALPATIARPNAQGASTATAGNFGASMNQTATTQLTTIDPKLVELGKKNTKRSDNGVDLNGMNQSFMKIFFAMVGEYFQKTGRGVQVNSAYRSIDKQRQLYSEYLARGKRAPAAAAPGSSKHNYGIAIDIQSADGNALKSMGLLDKYRFHRPLPSEPWHIENLGFGQPNQTSKVIAKDLKQPIKQPPVKKPEDKVAKTTVAAAEAPKRSLVDTVVNDARLQSAPSANIDSGRRVASSPLGQSDIMSNKPGYEVSPQDVARHAAAKQSAREQEAQQATKMRNAVDAQLEAQLGTNKRLDIVIELLKKMSKSSPATDASSTQPTAQQPTSASTTTTPVTSNRFDMNQSTARDYSDPMDMSKRNSA